MAEPTSPGSPESGNSGDHNPTNRGSSREHDRFFPNAKIGRIMRKATPENGKIAKEAAEFMQECAFEFVSFITSEAIDKCQRDRRKSINGDDLLWALGALGFEDYVKPLKLYLKLYREMEGDSKSLRSVDQSGKQDGPVSGASLETYIVCYGEHLGLPARLKPFSTGSNE